MAPPLASIPDAPPLWEEPEVAAAPPLTVAPAVPLPPTIPARRAARILATTACVVLATAYSPANLPLGFRQLRSAVLLPFAVLNLALAKAAVAVTGRLVLPSVVCGACA